MSDQRAAWRETRQRAEAYPWTAVSDGFGNALVSDMRGCMVALMSAADAQWAITARVAVPALLDEVDRLEARIADLEAALKDARV